MLGADQIELCGTMASRGEDKFDGVPYSAAPSSGAPVFAGAVATIDCILDSVLETGDHNLIVGLVQHVEATVNGGDPMVFFGGNYGTFS